MRQTILVAGATGDLGERIVKALAREDVNLRAVVRYGTPDEKIGSIVNLGAEVITVSKWDVEELAKACEGVSCVVSALAGLREVVIDAQKKLLDAAIVAKVPRFIPSDYSLDFTKFPNGTNRNLDWRREFHTYLDRQPISATSIFNGAFTELLSGEMPVIFFKKNLVLYWGNADSPWQFTTKDNVAAFTANAAIDPSTPRYLHIAGDLISPAELRAVMGELTGSRFRLLRTGGRGLLGVLISIARRFSPGKNELYPAWQGMQYMHNMIDKRARVAKLDNERYPGIQWTSVKDYLARNIPVNAG